MYKGNTWNWIWISLGTCTVYTNDRSTGEAYCHVHVQIPWGNSDWRDCYKRQNCTHTNPQHIKTSFKHVTHTYTQYAIWPAWLRYGVCHLERCYWRRRWVQTVPPAALPLLHRCTSLLGPRGRADRVTLSKKVTVLEVRCYMLSVRVK